MKKEINREITWKGEAKIERIKSTNRKHRETHRETTWKTTWKTEGDNREKWDT